jgi:hypothetical protein
MAPSKTISFYFQDNFIHTVDITSDMSEEDTYAAIRTKLAPLFKDEACIEIRDPGNNHNFVRIHYTCLKQGRIYHVLIVPEERERLGAQGKGINKVTRLLLRTADHWHVWKTTEILPADIAPPVEPIKWPVKFTSDLHKLAACTKDRHDEVMQVLRHQVQIRVQHAQNAVAVVTGEDIRAVASIMGAQMVDSAEDREDMEETERFAGGLGEAVEDALEEGEEGAAVSWEYEQEGRFNVAMR